MLRVDRAALLNDLLQHGDVREYGVADGLLGVESVKRHRILVTDSIGRVWFALSRGLSVADPTRADDRGQPAITLVEQMTADGAQVDVHGPIRIPSSRRRLAVTYAGLSLSVPERVRYRYRLDGFDSDWSDPVAERQAVYTNLAPGHYRFRVIASNSDGVWNGTEATMPFEVRAMFWQTSWFQLSAVVLSGLAGWGLYRLRVRQVARQLSTRFEERLAERTRIAQELHDTLLQGFVSASMQLHVAIDRLPEDSPAKPSLRRVLDLMGKVVDEGRNAVRGLRSSSSAPHELEQAFAGAQQEVGVSDAAYRVIVEGRPRSLKPIIRDEVYRIGREALVNAFRHSGATHIEIELEYGPKELSVFVRDDGRGVQPEVLEAGSEGHWGITGMRERAQRIGGSLRIRSRAAAGTEVELRIPAQVAFERQASGWPLGCHIVQEIPGGVFDGRNGESVMNSKRKIRVFSADDHPLLREGIAAIINNQDDMVMVAQASNGREAIRLFREHQPDVTLMDLRMPDISGIDALSAILGEFPDARIVMLTTFEGDVEIQRSLAAGARGYLLKNMPPNELVEVVRQVHAGRKRIPQEIAAQLAEHIADERLTDREVDVLQHVAGGNRNRDIAESLSISEETVKVHMKHIMEKLGATDRTAAVAIAVRRGIIQL